MEIELILRLFLAGAAIFIGLVLGIALLTSKKTNKYGNLFLLILIFFFIGQALDSFLMFTGLYKYVPHLVLAVYPIAFLIGPTYYFYIRIVLEPKFKFKWYDVIHLAFILNKSFYMIPFYIKPSIKKIELLKYIWFDNETKPNFYHFIRWSETDFLTIFYLIAVVLLINAALKSLKSKSSNTDIEYLVWLRKVTYIFIALSLLEIMRIFIVITYNLNEGKSEILSSVILLVFIIYLVFQMIRNPNRTFYKLNFDNFNSDKKRNNSFKFRISIFLNNLSSVFKKTKFHNNYLIIIVTTIIIIGSVYFYFFNYTFLKQKSWFYLITILSLFFMIFQFTIIDNHILYKNKVVVNNKFTILESTKKNQLVIHNSNDLNFLLSLKKMMIKERPYLNPDLKSHELANLLNVTPHYLSKIINQELGLNFYNFINNYRIEEFKERVLQDENKNFTLTGIAKDVGFNSKSSFNRVFKATVGLTPTEYLKTQKEVSTFNTDTIKT